MNRLKAAVLIVFLVYWVTVVAIFLAARPSFDLAMRRLGSSLVRIVDGDQLVADVLALSVLTGLFVLLSAGVIRNWRWTFWLILVAFAINGLRAPVAALQLLGLAQNPGPELITVLQFVVGLVQLFIAIAMLVGFRKAGLWGWIKSHGHR